MRLHPGGEPVRYASTPGRRTAVGLVTAAALGTLVWLAVTKISLAEVGHALARVDGLWVAAAAGAMALAFLARGESWYAALRAALPAQPIARGDVTRVLLIGIAGSAVAPGRLGEAARAWLMARRLGRPRDTLAAVVGTLLAQTLLNLGALALLTALAVSGSAIAGARSSSLASAVTLPVLAALLLVAGPALLPRGFLGRVRAQLAAVRRGLAVFRSPRAVAHSTVFQLGGWALQLGACYAVMFAFGLQDQAHPPGLSAAAAVLVAVNLTAVVPVTPSNVGVFQAACVAVLHPFGVSAPHALAYGIVLQAVEVGCGLALGLPALVREGVSLSEIRPGAGRAAWERQRA